MSRKHMREAIILIGVLSFIDVRLIRTWSFEFVLPVTTERKRSMKRRKLVKMEKLFWSAETKFSARGASLGQRPLLLPLWVSKISLTIVDTDKWQRKVLFICLGRADVFGVLPEDVEVPEAKTSGVYRPPGARLTTTKRVHNQAPPEIFSDAQFPSLSATAKHVETRKWVQWGC